MNPGMFDFLKKKLSKRPYNSIKETRPESQLTKETSDMYDCVPYKMWKGTYITYSKGWFLYVNENGASPISHARAIQFECDFCRSMISYNNMKGGYPLEFVPPRTYQVDALLKNKKEHVEPSGDLVIPARIGAYKITQIVENAFLKCNGITSIKLPSTIKKLCKNAFVDCKKLDRIDFGCEITDIEKSAFDGTPFYKKQTKAGLLIINNVLLKASEDISGEVVIPENVVSISGKAFEGCKKITSVTIHKNVKRIDYLAFSGCDLLEEVVFEDGFDFKNTDNSIFRMCKSLRNIQIPEGTKNVFTFENCASLKEILVPEGVKEMYSFNGCESLEKVNIPESVKTVYKEGFSGTAIYKAFMDSDETGLYIDNWLIDFKAPQNGVLNIRPGTVGIAGYSRPDIDSRTRTLVHGYVQKINLPDSLKYIGLNAFRYCPISEINLPDSLLEISDHAFAFTKLKKVTIPGSIKELNTQHFWYCSELEEIVFKGNTKMSGFVGSKTIEKPWDDNIVLGIPEDRSVKHKKKYNVPIMLTWLN